MEYAVVRCDVEGMIQTGMRHERWWKERAGTAGAVSVNVVRRVWEWVCSAEKASARKDKGVI
jgi:hypothetical protein